MASSVGGDYSSLSPSPPLVELDPQGPRNVE
jgi:hypothetical protein